MALDDFKPDLDPSMLSAIENATPNWLKDGLGVRGNPITRSSGEGPQQTRDWGSPASYAGSDPQGIDYSVSIADPAVTEAQSSLQQPINFIPPFALTATTDDSGEQCVEVNYGEVSGGPPEGMTAGDPYYVYAEGDFTFVYLKLTFDDQGEYQNATIETSSSDPNSLESEETIRYIILGTFSRNELSGGGSVLEVTDLVSTSVYADTALYVDNGTGSDTSYFYADGESVWLANGGSDGNPVTFNIDADSDAHEVTLTLDDGESNGSQLTTSEFFIGGFDDGGDPDPDKASFNAVVDDDGGEVTLTLDDGVSNGSQLNTSEFFIGAFDDGGDPDPDKASFNAVVDDDDGEVTLTLDDGVSNGSQLNTSEFFIGSFDDGGDPNPDNPSFNAVVDDDGGEVTLTLDDGSDATTELNTSSLSIQDSDGSSIVADVTEGTLVLTGTDGESATLDDSGELTLTDSSGTATYDTTSVTLADGDDAGFYVGSSYLMDDELNVDGDGTIDGELHVTGDTQLDSDLNVDGSIDGQDANFDGDVSVNSLSIGGTSLDDYITNIISGLSWTANCNSDGSITISANF